MTLSQLRRKKSTPAEYEPPIKPSEIPPGPRFLIRYIIACMPSISQFVSREKQREDLRAWAEKHGGSDGK